MYEYFYEHGYDGAWAWQLKEKGGLCHDDAKDIFHAVNQLSHRSDFGVIDIDLEHGSVGTKAKLHNFFGGPTYQARHFASFNQIFTLPLRMVAGTFHILLLMASTETIFARST